MWEAKVVAAADTTETNWKHKDRGDLTRPSDIMDVDVNIVPSNSSRISLIPYMGH